MKNTLRYNIRTFKLGKRIPWEDIKLGQSFYFTGCKAIGVKVNKRIDIGIFITDITEFSLWEVESYVGNNSWGYGCVCKFYELPKEVSYFLEN